ncbi:hypothetical protein [Nocardia concava]|uniref:hypothetical protein n=1 Tax=Nocardia concava TaxID=257281 RepID=UPI0002E1FE59|nr:hypothetical protein [Nocardia concava]
MAIIPPRGGRIPAAALRFPAAAPACLLPGSATGTTAPTGSGVPTAAFVVAALSATPAATLESAALIVGPLVTRPPAARRFAPTARVGSVTIATARATGRPVRPRITLPARESTARLVPAVAIASGRAVATTGRIAAARPAARAVRTRIAVSRRASAAFGTGTAEAAAVVAVAIARGRAAVVAGSVSGCAGLIGAGPFVLTRRRRARVGGG